jgi:hypothetical protein
MVLIVQPIHQEAVDEDQEDERNDAALVCKPETERKSGPWKGVSVQAIGEKDSGAESDRSPD